MRDDADKIRHSYNNVTYFMMGQLNINRENSLRLYVSSYTDNPSITDLQNVADVSDAQNITKGNPDLNPTYSHRVNFHYINSNVEKGRTFMWMFSMQNTSDYNATHVVSNPGTITLGGVQYKPNYYSTPVNLDGYWSLRTHLSYGFPIGFLKSNFNVMGGASATRLRRACWRERWTPTDSSRAASATTRAISATTSTRCWAAIFPKTWTSRSRGTAPTTKRPTRWASQVPKTATSTTGRQGNMKFVFPLGFTFTGSVAYTQYIGFTNDYDDSYLLCNAWIGKKIFKNKRGEIMFGVNDLLNRNKAFAARRVRDGRRMRPTA